MSAKRVRLASVNDIPKGEGRTTEACGRRLAVFHSREGRVFVTQADCPHKGGPLADGMVGGTTLVCPLHEWSFDLLSGMPLNGTSGIQVYPAHREADGTILVEMEDDGRSPAWRTTDYSKA